MMCGTRVFLKWSRRFDRGCECLTWICPGTESNVVHLEPESRLGWNRPSHEAPPLNLLTIHSPINTDVCRLKILSQNVDKEMPMDCCVVCFSGRSNTHVLYMLPIDWQTLWWVGLKGLVSYLILLLILMIQTINILIKPLYFACVDL